MVKSFSLKKLFIGILLLIPLIYISFGWYVGLSYGRKSAILGPYPDIPVVMKTSLLGAPLEDISGSKALVMVVPPKETGNSDPDSTYFKITGYFEVPGVWNFTIPGKSFALTGNYSRAVAHGLKDPRRNLGSLSVRELNDFLKESVRTKDRISLKPYLFLSNMEEKYPWLYSDTVLLSRAMGNIFKDNALPYDVLGLLGIALFFIVMATRSFWLWVYYLYWVFAYWFGRVGYHDSILALSIYGWKVILWSFWNGFIMKEGRLFLIIALGLSVIVLGILGILYLVKQAAVSLKRED